jgi:hypothetical protein
LASGKDKDMKIVRTAIKFNGLNGLMVGIDFLRNIGLAVIIPKTKMGGSFRTLPPTESNRSRSF